MWAYYLIIMLPALLVSLIGYYSTKDNHYFNKVTDKELAISLGANFIAGALMIVILQWYISSKLYDNYVLNGVVTKKYKDTVSCEHSYQVCTSTGKTTICTTHYEHWNDYDWVVQTSVGKLKIDRVDRQGTTEPSRFSNVVVGEPASLEFSYSNYLLADPNSLFLQNAQGVASEQYPRVYDYYRIKHILGYDDKELEKHLHSLLNGKRYNVVYVITNNESSDYFYTLMKSWKGGKINDIVVVLNIVEGQVNWIRANSYAKGMNNQLLLKNLESESLGKTFDKNLLTTHLVMIDNSFKIPRESDFEEKRSMVEIPMFLLIIVILINLGISLGIHIHMKKENL